MNASLANAVVTFLAAPSPQAAAAFRSFSLRQWNRSRHWLVVSGLALYLWEALTRIECGQVLPPSVSAWLADLWEASGRRVHALASDLTRLNQEFAALGLPYANWKGLAMAPEFCPDPRLRMQFDFDFLIGPGEHEHFAEPLQRLGYHFAGCEPGEFRYENMPGQLYSFDHIFRPKPHRKIELHDEVVGDFRGVPPPSLRGVLLRRTVELRDGSPFPVFAPADAFLAACLHVAKHAFSGWGRLDWLLELRYFASRNAGDTALWSVVRERGDECAMSAAMVGIAVELTAATFGWPRECDLSWASSALPRPARTWMKVHGRTWALADFPGTKSYLLLARCFMEAEHWREFERRKLFPFKKPPRVAQAATTAPGACARSASWQMRFVSMRLRLHLVEGARYLLQRRAWDRAALG